MAAEVEGFLSPAAPMQLPAPAPAPDSTLGKTADEQVLPKAARKEDPGNLETALIAKKEGGESEGGADEGEKQGAHPAHEHEEGAEFPEKPSMPEQAAAAPAPLQKRNHSRGDGYKWRQYGYKRLSCGVVKRLYFFCTARSQTGCTARKLVDRYVVTTPGEDEGGSTCADGDKEGAQTTTRVEDIVDYKGAHNHPPLPSPNSWPDAGQHPHAQHYQQQQQQMSGCSGDTGEQPFLPTSAPRSHALSPDGAGSSMSGNAGLPEHHSQFQPPLHQQHPMLQLSGSHEQHGLVAQHSQQQHPHMSHQPSGWYSPVGPQQSGNSAGAGPSYNGMPPHPHQQQQQQMPVQRSPALCAPGSNQGYAQPGHHQQDHPSGSVFSPSKSMPQSVDAWQHQHHSPHPLAPQRSVSMGSAYGAPAQSSMTLMSPTSNVMPGTGPGMPPGQDGPSAHTPYGPAQPQHSQQLQHPGTSNGNPMMYQQQTQSHSSGMPMSMNQSGSFAGSHSFSHSQQPGQQHTLSLGKPSGAPMSAPHQYGLGGQASPAMSQTTMMGPTHVPAQQGSWNMHQHHQQPQALRLEASPLALPLRSQLTPSQMAFNALPQVLPHGAQAMPGQAMNGSRRAAGPGSQVTQHQMLQAPSIGAPQARGHGTAGAENLQQHSSMAGRIAAHQGVQHQMPLLQQPVQQPQHPMAFAQQHQPHHPPSRWSAGPAGGPGGSLGPTSGHETCHKGADGAPQCSCHLSMLSSSRPDSRGPMQPPHAPQPHLHHPPTQQHLAHASCRPSTSEQSESNPTNMKDSVRGVTGSGPHQQHSPPGWSKTCSVSRLGQPGAAGSGPAPQQRAAKAVMGPNGEIIRWQHDEVRPAGHGMLGNSPTSATSPSSSLLPDAPPTLSSPVLAWKVDMDACHRQEKLLSGASASAELDGLRASKRHRPNELRPLSALSHSSGSPTPSLLATQLHLSPTFPHHTLASAPPTAPFPPNGGAHSPMGILSAPDSLLTSWLTEHSEGSMQSHSSVAGKGMDSVPEDAFFTGLIDYLANA